MAIWWAGPSRVRSNALCVVDHCGYMQLYIGVLLLNACLTVKSGEPNSHSGKVVTIHSLFTLRVYRLRCMDVCCLQGWERLTDAVIHWINDHCSGVVFLLWGAYAQKKGSFINQVLYTHSAHDCRTMLFCFLIQKKHCVLKTAHPSPLSASRGFFGCKHFSRANDFLRRVGKREIDWNYLPKEL